MRDIRPQRISCLSGNLMHFLYLSCVCLVSSSIEISLRLPEVSLFFRPMALARERGSEGGRGCSPVVGHAGETTGCDPVNRSYMPSAFGVIGIDIFSPSTGFAIN